MNKESRLIHKRLRELRFELSKKLDINIVDCNTLETYFDVKNPYWSND